MFTPFARPNWNLIAICQSGIWGKQKNQMPGYYQNLGVASGTYYGHNPNPVAVIIQATGGACGNKYSLTATVSGVGVVASNIDNNNEWWKGTSISFPVPAYTSYQISSYPFECGGSPFSILLFTMG